MEAAMQTHQVTRSGSEPREMGAIPTRLDEVQKQIEEAHGLADRLENRLLAVSSGPFPELAVLGEVREEASPVAERLSSHRDGMQSLINRMRNLETRLDL
jgi:hypothetical protein